MILTLTPQQGRNLLVLIDLAVKAGGLRVATEAVILQALITRAAEQVDVNERVTAAQALITRAAEQVDVNERVTAVLAENPSGLQPDGSGPG